MRRPVGLSPGSIAIRVAFRSVRRPFLTVPTVQPISAAKRALEGQQTALSRA